MAKNAGLQTLSPLSPFPSYRPQIKNMFLIGCLDVASVIFEVCTRPFSPNLKPPFSTHSRNVSEDLQSSFMYRGTETETVDSVLKICLVHPNYNPVSVISIKRKVCGKLKVERDAFKIKGALCRFGEEILSGEEDLHRL